MGAIERQRMLASLRKFAAEHDGEVSNAELRVWNEFLNSMPRRQFLEFLAWYEENKELDRKERQA